MIQWLQTGVINTDNHVKEQVRDALITINIGAEGIVGGFRGMWSPSWRMFST